MERVIAPGDAVPQGEAGYEPAMFHPQGPTLLELTRQALTSTERGYDLLAPKFDHTPFRTPTEVVEGVLGDLDGLPVRVGLDLCCGTGVGVSALRAHCTEAVVGVDMSRGMLDVARASLAAEGPPVSLLRADVLTHPFAPEHDLVTCWGAFGHLLPEQEPLLLDQVARALRPGGRFVFVTADDPSALDWRSWVLRGFNATMRVRNALIRPPFVMYYLGFRTSRVVPLLEARGFQVEVRARSVPPPWDRLDRVIARIPG